jgi:hypothetical protein
MGGEKLAHGGGPGTPGIPFDRRLDGMLVEQAQELRLVECPLDAPLGYGLGEVDQGSRDGGHRDALDHRRVGARKLRSVDADAASWLAAGPSRNRDVDPGRGSLPQSPEVCGRPVAERGALAEASTAAILLPGRSRRGWPTA